MARDVVRIASRKRRPGATHVFPLRKLVRDLVLDLTPLEHPPDPPLRILQDCLGPRAQERQPREDHRLERRSRQRRRALARTPLRDGLVELWQDELVKDVVVHEAGEERRPGLEQKDGRAGVRWIPVVAWRGRKKLDRSIRREKLARGLLT